MYANMAFECECGRRWTLLFALRDPLRPVRCYVCDGLTRMSAQLLQFCPNTAEFEAQEAQRLAPPSGTTPCPPESQPKEAPPPHPLVGEENPTTKDG